MSFHHGYGVKPVRLRRKSSRGRKALSRSKIMSRIRSRDTVPELIVRSVVHRLGFRFRLHRKGLPGTPDLVFPSRRAAVFVHGCFWHCHAGCKRSFHPKTNKEFWTPKLDRNVERDRDNQQRLGNLGWRLLVVWECEVGDKGALAARLKAFLGHNSLMASPT